MLCLRSFQKGHRRFSLRPLMGRAAAGLLVFLLPGLLPAVRAGAASPPALVAQGNKAYAAGDYKKALELYDQADHKAQLPIISYDRGNALYRLGKFGEARKAYDKAVEDLKNAELATRGFYNMGNAAYRQGAEREKQDPNKALSLFSESAAAFREALRRDPTFAGAGANLELANRKIKELAALTQKQHAAPQQGRSSGQKTGQEQGQGQDSSSLKDLANRQKQLAAQTDKLRDTRQGNPEERQKTENSLAAQQQKLRRQTEENAQTGTKAGSPQTRKDLREAAELQKKAEEKLHRDQVPQAAELQKQAAEKLARAAADKQQKEKKQAADRQKQKKTTGDQGHQQATAANEEGADRNQGQQNTATAPLLDPRQILNQEKIHRQLRRQRMTAAGSLRVEKDW